MLDQGPLDMGPLQAYVPNLQLFPKSPGCVLIKENSPIGEPCSWAKTET
ncbi:hypothetical protein OH784_14770 [Ectobacillus funiculus]